MFEGKVKLINRKNRVHCGVLVRRPNEYILVSVCNGWWKHDDNVTDGEAKEVTCKRCRKIIERADSDGQVKL